MVVPTALMMFGNMAINFLEGVHTKADKNSMFLRDGWIF